jgi:hypothetical protein
MLRSYDLTVLDDDRFLCPGADSIAESLLLTKSLSSKIPFFSREPYIRRWNNIMMILPIHMDVATKRRLYVLEK